MRSGRTVGKEHLVIDFGCPIRTHQNPLLRSPNCGCGRACTRTDLAREVANTIHRSGLKRPGPPHERTTARVRATRPGREGAESGKISVRSCREATPARVGVPFITGMVIADDFDHLLTAMPDHDDSRESPGLPRGLPNRSAPSRMAPGRSANGSPRAADPRPLGAGSGVAMCTVAHFPPGSHRFKSALDLIFMLRLSDRFWPNVERRDSGGAVGIGGGRRKHPNARALLRNSAINRVTSRRRRKRDLVGGPLLMSSPGQFEVICCGGRIRRSSRFSGGR